MRGIVLIDPCDLKLRRWASKVGARSDVRQLAERRPSAEG
jgi:hypothetical protein